MKISELLEDIKAKKLCVVFGGRFQPFHKGHYDAYKGLCKKFGDENVWIATSNSTNFNPTNGNISPFTFSEKKEIMVSLYDINPRRIIQCKNPAFKPVEIFDLYKNYPIIYISAVGKKDEERYKTGTFFKPLPLPFVLKDVEALSTAEDGIGYFTNIPMTKDISGTQVREALANAQGDEREILFKKFFGKYDSIIDQLLIAKLKDIKDESTK